MIEITKKERAITELVTIEGVAIVYVKFGSLVKFYDYKVSRFNQISIQQF